MLRNMLRTHIQQYFLLFYKNIQHFFWAVLQTNNNKIEAHSLSLDNTFFKDITQFGVNLKETRCEM